MQIEYVAGVGFASRGPAQKERKCAVCHGVLGKVVVDDEHVLAPVHKVFCHRAARIGRYILQRSAVACKGRHYYGVFHCAALSEHFGKACNRAGLLADSYVYADYALALLVEYGIGGYGGLARLPVAYYEFALAPADGEHRVYREYARFERPVYGLPVDYAGRGSFDGHIGVGLYLAAAVDGRAERVDYPAYQPFACGYARRLARAVYLAALFDFPVVAEEYYAASALAELLHHSLYAAFKGDDFAVFD